MTSAFSLNVSTDGIADLIFDVPGEKVNTFSLKVLEELEGCLDRLKQNTTVKVLKLRSAKQDSFIAGADLKSIVASFKAASSSLSETNRSSEAENLIITGHRVFSKLQNLPFPTIAVIHGSCVGGGLECALSCTYRVVTDHPKTKLGLPEVSIGLFPGWGGTQRLPRLIGFQEGLLMVLSGSSVSAQRAWKIHLADAVVAPEFIETQTDAFVQEILTKEGVKRILSRRNKRNVFHQLLESNFLTRELICYRAKKMTLEKTKGHYPAPLLALELIKKTYHLPLEKGLKEEIREFIANISTGFRLAEDLIHLFFVQEAVKKNPGLIQQVPPLTVASSVVIGSGTMGAEISWLLADHQIFVRLKDVSWELVGKGLAAAKSLFDKELRRKKMQRCEYERRNLLISGTIDYSGFQHADYVIEAATENLEIKKKIFQEVEAVVHANTIIATNTSSLTVAELTQGLKSPERFVGMHFFFPVSKMPLVEVISGKMTSPQALATAVDLCKKLGKTPIVVGDCPGFLVNRILLPGVNEMMLMLEEGYSIEDLDRVFLQFGMPMKPFVLADEIGNDVTYKAAKSLEKGYGERMRPPKILQLMVEKGLYGRKSKKGFYLYNGPDAIPNPEIKELIKSIGREQKERHVEEILPRFLYPMINEAARCLDEKVIDRADFLDLSLILGIGFPPFRGGLLRYADKVGIARVVQGLRSFERLGKQYEPCDLLLRMTAQNQTFHT